ncbi:hypothetical protein [Clostridium sardiniense]|uniref:hypothetical protein n=1 Tax=Clostridium sardiniense TaxID=29369 RepID=UPI0019586B80|nr:hypothetical protein [Clostridium sardiniense]MBM7835740.1 hypothetical protein [Clostridium sardiniense]
MEEQIILERHRQNPYTVNYENKKYEWLGARNGVPSVKKVPREVYDFIAMGTSALESGKLVLGKKISDELKKDLLEEIPDVEKYEKNALTKEEVEKMLKGNLKSLEKAFSEIEEAATKQFIYKVAKEIKIENANKQKMIKDLLGSGLSIEELFGEE